MENSGDIITFYQVLSLVCLSNIAPLFWNVNRTIFSFTNLYPSKNTKLFAIFIFLIGYDLVCFCLKDISTCNLPKILQNLKFINQIPSLNSSFALKYSKTIVLTNTSSNYFLQNVKWSNWLLPKMLFFLAPKTSPKCYLSIYFGFTILIFNFLLTVSSTSSV